MGKVPHGSPSRWTRVGSSPSIRIQRVR
jgi:hypothetical protein